MLIITKESVKELRERLKDPDKVDQCRDEVRKMLEIKGSRLWRAEAGSCCNLQPLAAQLAWEVQDLEDLLTAIEKDKTVQAASMLEDYIQRVDWSWKEDEKRLIERYECTYRQH